MAHIAKYKVTQVAAMGRHYLRENQRYGNENIDPERTHLNVTVAAPQIANGDVTFHGFIEEKMEACKELTGRAVRSDAVVMCDWVVTAPKDVEENRYGEFFGNTIEFLRERYGSENMIAAAVHMDEATPHVHYSFTPCDEDGRFRAKNIIDRNDLRSFHDDLQQHLQQTMGKKYSILLEPEQAAERELSKVPHEQYKMLDDELKRKQELNQEADRDIEYNRDVLIQQKQQYDEMRVANQALQDRNSEMKHKAVEIDETIGCLRQQNEELAQRREYLQRSCEKQERAIGGADARIRELEQRISGVRERIGEQEQTRELSGEAPSIVRELVSGAQRIGNQARTGAEPISDREQRERARAQSLERKLEPERNAAQERIRGLESERADARQSFEKTEKALREAEQQIGRAEQRLSALRERREQLRERVSESFSRLKSIMDPRELMQHVRDLGLQIRTCGEKLANEIGLKSERQPEHAQSLNERMSYSYDAYRAMNREHEFSRSMDMGR